MDDLVSMRVEYGKALAAYGEQNRRVVVLDADVSGSTQSHFFAKQHPERFFNLGVAEAGMVDVAAGLALGGYIPFVNTFAFLIALRAAEQVRTCVAYAHTNVKLVGSYGGLSDSFDGPTHHAITDIAIMRAIPNMTVVVPADAVESAKMVAAIAEYSSPVYLRLSRAELPLVYDQQHEVEIGKGMMLKEGSDVTLVATGVMVDRALQAAEELALEGVEARVLALHTIKPLDEALVLEAAEGTGAIVTCEEHSIVGGLGAAVAELLGGKRPVPVLRVGVADRFCESGPYSDLLDRYGMSIGDMVATAKQAMRLRDNE